MAKTSDYSTIDQYIAAAAPAVRPILNEIRRVAKRAVPQAQETISYKLPALKLERTFFYFAAFEEHIGVYPPVTGDASLRKQLVPYANEKGNLKFPLREAIPYTLIVRVAVAPSKQYSKMAAATTKPVKRKASKSDANGDDQVAAYSQAQSLAFRAISDELRKLITTSLPKAEYKVWHGSPVWFIDENPVVGYNATAKTVNLLFWNGQAFDEPGLKPVGKYRAAHALFEDASEIDHKVVRRWLKKAKSDVFDSKAFFKKLREKK